MTVVTRFAPSPTGFLHIGGARTALFNWLYAKRHNGKFLLRIEDTDRERSTQEAIDAILKSMDWLGLHWDGETYYQAAHIGRHTDIAKQLIAEGKAYYCYCSPEEVEVMREKAKAEKRPMKYDGTWRDRDASEAPEGVKPVVRIKAPLEGSITIKDSVQGDVTFSADQMDDFIILRSDGTPTYMLAVVVDDHDMGVTHIIRGDDHLTNAARQTIIYQAMGWDVPNFSHIPLIHGADGAKLSKRHGALGAEAYEAMGYLPEALNNYLLRLGWSHGDDEIIPVAQAIEWFNLEHIGKSPSRFDMAKLDNLNGHYIREADDARLVGLITPLLEQKIGKALSDTHKNYLLKGMDGLKQRAKTILELAESALFYVDLESLEITDKAKKQLEKEGYEIVPQLIEALHEHNDWSRDALEAMVHELAERNDVKMGGAAGAIRAGLTRSHAAPSVFDLMVIFGKDETLRRMQTL